ncbi:MAG: M16 family metallopeptidase, partial [Burkholderiales bacterium]
DGHDGARFTRNLVRGSRIASEAGAGYDALARGPALFVVEATPAEGRSVEDLERALRAEIRRVAEEGITEEELTRVKAQVIASQVFKRDSIVSQAMEIAIFEMSGFSHRRIDATLDKIRAVTAAQVKDVAARYFGDDTLTVATLTPLPMTSKPRAAPGGLRH